ncbi:putative PAN domain-containing protein [Tupanvirus deep ocean]|uniref:PAN domain-containing protein n=2 Tax=Tupanvirus TaxID=2094720 RepID=A0AC62A8V4_9VIRU|nr:putative PAN domain-containing protein [Tupanvirus deep ocean]QKU34210.1 putative PAN domain-containing protein [Tupanvirus deep ocean]
MDKQKNVAYIVIAVAIIIVIIIIPLTYIIYNDYIYSSKDTTCPVVPIIPVVSPPTHHQPPVSPIISPPTHHQLLESPIPCPEYARYVNANIYGKSIDDTPMKNITEHQCQQACDLKQCDWYNYDQNKKFCWLKQGSPKNNYVTGFNVRDTPKNLNCPGYHIIQNMDVNGNIVNHTRNIDANGCQTLCDSMTCDWYNYNNDTQECWIKRANITNDMITGIKL